jgi:hypothetical protein
LWALATLLARGFLRHILEHEDVGMMINYKVVDPDGP